MSLNPPSPTGTPVIPPQYVPFLLALLTAINGGLAYLSQQDVSPTVKMLCTVLLAVLGPLMAAVSPGLRKGDGAGALKALLVVLGLGLAAVPAPARAQGFDWAVGPSIPLLQYDLGQKAAPVQLAPGWGVQVSGTSKALQVQWLGRRWDLVSLNVLFFGSLVTSSGVPLGQLSLAAGPCLMSSVVCLAYGHQVLAENSALVGGPGFLLLAFNFNFSVEPGPPPAPAFDRPTLAALPRGNTLYFGGP